MPLPDNGAVWPPDPHHHAYEAYEVYDAWYAGNIEALETLYSTTRLVQQGGIWGQAKRFFMGTPNPGQQSQRPIKTHVPIPAAIARMSSSLLWGEMPNIEIGDLNGDADDKGITTETQSAKINARLTNLLDDQAHAQFLEAGELGAALGGAFLRVTWDKTVVPDKPFITAVAADAAVPDFRYGRLSAVTFWTDLPMLTGNPARYRLLERHEPGTVEWGLYQSQDGEQLGVRVPLTDHPSTEPLAAVVNADSLVETGSEYLTAVYIPNVKPNRSYRKDPVAQHLGRSDYDGVEQLFDALNETITSWQRDIRLGKARVLVNRELLDVNKPGNGAWFNADQEIFSPLGGGVPGAVGSQGPGATSGGSNLIEQVQFKIRVQEHSDTAQALLEQIFMACGYSMQTFGLSSSHAPRSVTATEVDSREHMTMLTRASKIMYARPPMQALLCALLDVDQHVFNGPGRAQAVPDVEFPDAAAPSMDALATTLQLITAAEAASTEVKVAMLHPDWDDAQIDEEVERIKNERAPAPVLDPLSIHPGPPDGADDPGMVTNDTEALSDGGSTGQFG